MTANDTVYCWTQIQHPTGLLVSIGSALVGGARLAWPRDAREDERQEGEGDDEDGSL